MSLDSIWNELASDTSAASGMTRRRIEQNAKCDIFLGMEKPENSRLLLIEVPASLLVAGTTLPKSRGFTVTATPLTPGPQGQVRLTLQHTQKVFPEIFVTLCSDVINHVARATSPQAAVRAFIARLMSWQKFLEKYSAKGLSEEEQIGLYGELWFLKHHLLDHLGPAAAVAAWTGPEGANQDFQFGGIAVEVKATRANTHQNLHISNVRQLDSTGIGLLLLFQLSLDARQGEIGSLNDLVSELRETFKMEPLALLGLDDRLKEVGYFDPDAQKYESTVYAHRAHHFFHVTDGFPRIVEQDLRTGVGDVQYSVALAACMPYAMDDKDALPGLSSPKAI